MKRYPFVLLTCLAFALPASAQVSAPLGGGATAPAPAASSPAAATTPAGVADDYRLDTDDTVTVAVTRHADVAGTYRIPPDGLLRLPRLVTPIMARNKTASELVADITGKLVTEGGLVLRPGQVHVAVVATRIRRVFVNGNATKGGDFDLKNNWHVADLVAILGTTPPPDRVAARITNPRRPQPVTVNLDNALKSPDSPDNIALAEGDTLTLNLPRAKRLLVDGEGPKGIHEVDERFGLKNALISLGYTTNGATGDLKGARLIRNAVPGDRNSPQIFIPVDLLTLLTRDDALDIAFQDLDTLQIPVSEKYVYVLGEVSGGQKKWYMPQDRKTYLLDVITNVGDVTNTAKIGDIKVFRLAPDGTRKQTSYDFGRYLKNADAKDNPEIMPQDVVVVPTVKHPDVIGNIWTGVGLFNVLRTFGIR